MFSFTKKVLSFITVLTLVGTAIAPTAPAFAEESTDTPVEAVVEVVESVETPVTEEATVSAEEPAPAEPETTPLEVVEESAVEPATTTEKVVMPEEEPVASTTPEETSVESETTPLEEVVPTALLRLVTDSENDSELECVDQLDGDWSDNLVSASQGQRYDGSAVLPDRSVAMSALDNLTVFGSTGFYSLGFGGSIVVSFDNYVIDVPGDDVTVFETTYTPYPLETALVEVSQDGTTWYVLGTAAQPGASSFDLTGSGVEWFRYVRVTDTTDKSLFSNYPDADGFDVNAIRASATVCDEPVPPTYTISGYKWNDRNGDGIWGDDEPGLAGWTIVATENSDSDTPATFSDVTDTDGSYVIEVPAGSWIVTEVQQAGWKQTAPIDPDYCAFEFGEDVLTEAVAYYESKNTCDFGNQQIPNVQCIANMNLIENGSFETPDLPVDGFGWDIYDSALSGLAWIVEWLNLSKDSPTPAKLELQSGYYAASAGAQYAELDSNWNPAPGGPYYGEDARVKIYQTINTVPGATYKVTYDFSPLPRYGTSTNVLNVMLDGGLVASHSADGTGLTDTAWTSYTYSFVATTSVATIGFADGGDADSFGTLIDNVAVTCMPVVEEEPEEEVEETGGSTSRGSRGGRRLVSDDTLSTPTPTPMVLGEQVSVVPQGAPGAGHGGSSSGTQLTSMLLCLNPRSERFSK